MRLFTEQIILFENIYFESIGGNFKVTGFLFTNINAVSIKICWFFAKISKNNNHLALKSHKTIQNKILRMRIFRKFPK